MVKRSKPCAKRVCPTNIKNSAQKKNLFYVTKAGSLGRAPMKNQSGGKKRIIKRNAVKVKSGEMYYLKKSSNGKLKIHRAKMKNSRR